LQAALLAARIPQSLQMGPLPDQVKHIIATNINAASRKRPISIPNCFALSFIALPRIASTA
jgi:hypothetical protein